jgi:predicted Holliday junction resolvase-like endonuclease
MLRQSDLPEELKDFREQMIKEVLGKRVREVKIKEALGEAIEDAREKAAPEDIAEPAPTPPK